MRRAPVTDHSINFIRQLRTIPFITECLNNLRNPSSKKFQIHQRPTTTFIHSLNWFLTRLYQRNEPKQEEFNAAWLRKFVLTMRFLETFYPRKHLLNYFHLLKTYHMNYSIEFIEIDFKTSASFNGTRFTVWTWITLEWNTFRITHSILKYSNTYSKDLTSHVSTISLSKWNPFKLV